MGILGSGSGTTLPLKAAVTTWRRDNTQRVLLIRQGMCTLHWLHFTLLLCSVLCSQNNTFLFRDRKETGLMRRA